MKIVAKALVSNNRGKVLVLRRSNTHPYFAHHFDLPGGEVEPGEDAAAAVARELIEETGLTVDPSKLKLAFTKNPSQRLQHLLFVAQLQTIQPTLSLSWEHDDYQWITPNDLLKIPLPGNVDSYYADVVEWLQSNAVAWSNP